MEIIESIQEKQKRPTMLAVLCILTFINTGLGLISEIISMAMGPWTDSDFKASEIAYSKSLAEIEKANLGDFWREFIENAHQVELDMQHNFWLVMGVSFIMLIIGLMGAILMWKGRKLGFHLYIIYCLISVGSVYTYTAAENVHMFILVTGLLFSGLFILLYSRSLKWME